MIPQILAGLLVTCLGCTPTVKADESSPAVNLRNSYKQPRRGTQQPTPSNSKSPTRANVHSATPATTPADGIACGHDNVHGFTCSTPPTPSTPTGSPTTSTAPAITPGQVITATRQIGLAKGTVSIQPSKGTTLVNLPTILSTQQTTLHRTVTLLGTPVEITATPATYLWRHGDGTTQRSHNPGRPYPHKDITHRYLQPAKRLLVSVDITYRVTYSIAGGPTQNLDEPIITTGPTTALRVREVIPVLIHGDD